MTPSNSHADTAGHDATDLRGALPSGANDGVGLDISQRRLHLQLQGALLDTLCKYEPMAENW